MTCPLGVRMLYPFMLFYLAGRRGGLFLVTLAFIAIASIYWAYPLLDRPPRVPYAHFLQLLLAYATAAALAYYQEAIRARHEELLTSLSERDFLTGLDNRRGFLGKAVPLLAQAKRLQQPFCIVLIDLDDFKQINDNHGHETGDASLRSAAEIIRSNSRAYDLVARWGGEEFILLLPQCSASGGWSLAEKMRCALSEQPQPHGRLTASMGLAVYDGEATLDALIARADRQLYKAKENGKNCVLPAIPVLEPA